MTDLKALFYVCVLPLFLLFSSITLAQAQVCDAADECWYAAPNGTGAVCSFNQPCTIEAATEKLSGGDILYLKSGTYTAHYANYQLEALINFDKFFSFQSPLPSAESPVIIKSLEHQKAIIQGDYTKQCVVLDRDHVQFDGLVIRRCNGAGVRIYNDINGNHIHVRNSLIEDIRGSDNMGGVYIGNAAGAVIENNEFRNNAPSSPTNGNCYSIVLFQGADVTIRNNFFHDTCGGIYFKHGERETNLGGFTRIHGNTFKNIGTTSLGKSGIWMNQNRAEIYDNLMLGVPIVIHPNVDGTQAPNSTDAMIHHNTLVDTYIGLGHKRESPSVGALRPTVRNNVFYNSGYSIWRYGSDQEFTDGIGLVSDNNCFYKVSGDQEISYFSDGGSFGDLGDVYSLAEFKSILGFELNSIETDPLFINAAAGDYRLMDSSACKAIDAGVRFGSAPPPGSAADSLCFAVKSASEKMSVVCL